MTHTARELKDQIEAERRGTPFLLYKAADGNQQILALGEDAARITVGRGSATDLWLDWDTEVSRVHAELERIGDDWTIADDGLSRNGTFVNGERISGRKRLRDRDVLRFGGTTVTYRAPLTAEAGETSIAPDLPEAASLSPMQKKVLTSLCRPFRDGSAYATPATNQQIADEVFLSVDAVKTHLRALFAKFQVEQLPQNQKRVRLVEKAFQSGVITPRDL